MTILAPKPVGRRARKPGIDRKPRQAYSAKQLDRLENEFKVNKPTNPKKLYYILVTVFLVRYIFFFV